MAGFKEFVKQQRVVGWAKNKQSAGSRYAYGSHKKNAERRFVPQNFNWDGTEKPKSHYTVSDIQVPM